MTPALQPYQGSHHVRAAESGIEGHTAADAARTEVVTVDPSTSRSRA